MRRIDYLFVILAFSVTSCSPKVIWTNAGGVRLVNSDKFQYKNPLYDNGQRAKIDTNYIFELDYENRFGEIIRPEESRRFESIRFFSTGQVLFFNSYNDTIGDEINNINAGYPGYFMVEDTKIKMDHWVNIFGDQTPEYYGLILNDSTLKLYETYVPDCRGSFDCLEMKNHYSIWRKNKNKSLLNYKPDW